MKNKAFSLIEMMVVITIISLIAAIAIPNFVRYQRERQFQAEIKSDQHDREIYHNGFNDGMNFVVEHGKWTGTNVQVNAEEIFKAEQY